MSDTDQVFVIAMFLSALMTVGYCIRKIENEIFNVDPDVCVP